VKSQHILKATAVFIVLSLIFCIFHFQNNKITPVFLPYVFPCKTLIIDAGHGGEDGGAVSANGTVESRINLDIALRLNALAGLCGMNSFLLRDSDISLHDVGCETIRQKKVSDLHNRVKMIEETNDAVLISIHQNIFQNSKYRGAQVFIGKNQTSPVFAQIMQDTISQLDPSNKRVPAPIPKSVYLMNHISCPAILVECGFLSNPEEEALLQTSNYQTKLAMAMTSSYIKYCNQNTEEGEFPK